MQKLDTITERILRNPSLGGRLSLAEQLAVECYVASAWQQADGTTAEHLARIMSAVPSLAWLQYLAEPQSPTNQSSGKALVLAMYEEEIRASIAEVLANDGNNA